MMHVFFIKTCSKSSETVTKGNRLKMIAQNGKLFATEKEQNQMENSMNYNWNMKASEYDETFSEKEIDLIDELLSESIEKGKIKDKDDIIKALQ